MDSLMRRFNHPITPKQSVKLMKLLKVNKPVADIVKEAGASIAIGTMIHAVENKVPKAMVILPAECFCDEYDRKTGMAKIETLRKPAYKDGISLLLLVELTEKGAKALKDMEAKRQTMELGNLSSDGLGQILEVRRFKIIE